MYIYEVRDTIPDSARIVRDGEALRLLGGWIGYKMDVPALWEKRVSNMEAQVAKWAKRRPIMKGRVIVVNYVILSKAQYMLRTNDPDKMTVDRVVKCVRNMMWAGKAKSILKLDDLYRPVGEGGLGLPSFPARQEASSHVAQEVVLLGGAILGALPQRTCSPLG